VRRIKFGVAGVGAAALVVTGAGVANAVSSGGYSPQQQGCSLGADANNSATAEPGCHNLVANVDDGQGRRYVQAGTYQTPNNVAVHSGNVAVDSNGDGTGTGASGTFDTSNPGANTIAVHHGTPNSNAVALATAFGLYFGADDNLDFGEHDGVDGRYGTSQAFNGPSDGGALVFNWHPGQVAGWTPQDAPTNPVPVADAGGGGCADGTCLSAQTRQRTVYNGTGSAPSRDAYNYQGKQFDPYNCSSGDAKSEQSCHGGPGQPQDMNGWRAAEAQHVNAEPGVQVYEDPDPQGSPAGPPQLYPLPALYAGTCGVVAGGGAAQAPASPVTNGAGQVAVAPTGC
jgi:hypothetical protein